MPAPGSPSIASVSLPSRPPAQPRPPFPFLAVLAPLAGALVLFAITRSPLMIAFAALSPVIAIASSIDGRVAARRRRRVETREYARARERFLDDVSAAHDAERGLLNATHPRVDDLMTDPGHRVRRWTAPSERFTALRLATGQVSSSLSVAGGGDTDDDRRLLTVCRFVEDAPVIVDPTGGIGIVGSAVVGRAFLRGLVVQLADAHPPGVLAIAAPQGDAYDWLDDYPHAAHADAEPLRLHIVDGHADAAVRADGAASGGGAAASVESGVAGTGLARSLEVASRPRSSPFAGSAETVLFALAADVDELPAACREVVRVDAAGGLTRLGTRSAAPRDAAETADDLHAELVTARSAAIFGDDLAAAARSRGVTTGRALPDSVAFADLPAPPPGTAPDGLPAVIGLTASGALMLDLVSSGPHAIVTGTTGSGKSELLTSWVLGMASRHAPDRVGFLLVDFKGGTAFTRLSTLPHTVGVVTDLGHGEADRALKSLRAELRRREAALAELGVSDVRDSERAPARLVIVVDEAAAMLAAFPDLASLFSDIAARGRALGVHLILGTQRSTGVLADALVANCSLRISLRLSSQSDSTALLGSDIAARLPHGVPGRVVVARDGDLVTAQTASASASDVTTVRDRYDSWPPVRAPWLPALPDRIPLSAFGAVPHDAVVLGALDDPERQAQEGILYRPHAAHLLVLGVRGVGKTTALRAVAAQSRARVLNVPADIEGAWDALGRAEAMLHSPAEPILVIIDDLDALLARFGDDHREEVQDRLRSLLIDGPRSGVAIVCSARALPSGLRSAAGHFGERLILRQSDRQEHVLAGAPHALFDEAAPPGRGVWHGLLAQIVDVPDDVGSAGAGLGTDERSGGRTAEPLVFPAGSTTALVCRTPGVAIKRLLASDQHLSVVDLTELGRGPLGTTPGWVTGTAAGTMAGSPATTIEVSTSADPTVIVGDPDSWQSCWQLLARLRKDSAIVFDGCTLAQLRAIVHARVLPPATLPSHALRYAPDGSFTRVVLPG